MLQRQYGFPSTRRASRRQAMAARARGVTPGPHKQVPPPPPGPIAKCKAKCLSDVIALPPVMYPGYENWYFAKCLEFCELDPAAPMGLKGNPYVTVPVAAFPSCPQPCKPPTGICCADGTCVGSISDCPSFAPLPSGGAHPKSRRRVRRRRRARAAVGRRSVSKNPMGLF